MYHEACSSSSPRDFCLSFGNYKAELKTPWVDNCGLRQVCQTEVTAVAKFALRSYGGTSQTITHNLLTEA